VNRSYPEPASTTTIVLLSAATLAAAVGAVFWWHRPLGFAALVTGSYVLHLIAIRRSASDVIVHHSRKIREDAVLMELEYQSKLRELDQMHPQLERERNRLQEQWEHLRGLIDDRQTRKAAIRNAERELEQVRKEAAAALEAGRRDARIREEREARLQERIRELEQERERVRRQWHKVKGLVAERQSRERKIREYELELDEVRAEAARALQTVERAARLNEERESELLSRIAMLEEEHHVARQRDLTIAELSAQVEELEADRREAETALAGIAARHPRRTSAAPGPNGTPSSQNGPRLRAWQFIAHKQGRAQRPEADARRPDATQPPGGG
jgi:hypothetical protein